MMRWVGHVTFTEKIRNATRVLVGRHEENIQDGRPWHKWDNNIKINLKNIGWKGVYWIHLAKDGDQWQTLVHTVTNLLSSIKCRNYLTSQGTISFSRRTQLHGSN
jgi:hypothetical protein